MQKILIMVFALALNGGLSLQASGEPAGRVTKENILRYFASRIEHLQISKADDPEEASSYDDYDRAIGQLQETKDKIARDEITYTPKCMGKDCQKTVNLKICDGPCNGALFYCSDSCKRPIEFGHAVTEYCLDHTTGIDYSLKK